MLLGGSGQLNQIGCQSWPQRHSPVVVTAGRRVEALAHLQQQVETVGKENVAMLVFFGPPVQTECFYTNSSSSRV